jgi:hypothetical protein
MFDAFGPILDPRAHKRLLNGWHGVFRHIVLEALSDPVQRVARRFCADKGAPNKELYSMVGLLLIKEFMDWTTAEAANEYMFNASIQSQCDLDEMRGLERAASSGFRSPARQGRPQVAISDLFHPPSGPSSAFPTALPAPQ